MRISSIPTHPLIKIAVACSWVWTLSGHGQDGLRELLRVKDLMDAQPLMDPEASQLRASLLRSIGLVANPVGNLELAAEVCAEAADLHLRLGDNEQAAAALLTLGIARWARGEFSESRHALQAARDLTAECTTSWHHVAARVLLARTLLDEGAPEADSSLDTALRFAQTAGDRHMLGLALACRSRWFLVQDDALTSEMAAREAARVAHHQLPRGRGDGAQPSLPQQPHVRRTRNSQKSRSAGTHAGPTR